MKSIEISIPTKGKSLPEILTCAAKALQDAEPRLLKLIVNQLVIREDTTRLNAEYAWAELAGLFHSPQMGVVNIEYMIHPGIMVKTTI